MIGYMNFKIYKEICTTNNFDFYYIFNSIYDILIVINMINAFKLIHYSNNNKLY